MKTLLAMMKDSLVHLSMINLRLLPIGKNKKEIDFFKDELGGKIMK